MSPAPQSTKQPPMWKEWLMVLCLMIFLGVVGFGLAWYKGHTIWQPNPENHEEY